MRKVGEELSDHRSQLVLQICSVATRYRSCTHRINVEPTFVDWYRILQVEEVADVDRIRKKYLKLALQIHPDKNKHPKAEVAFKLVSQAYTCLSDDDTRRSFDVERSKSLCIECNKMQQRKFTSNNLANAIAAKLKGFNLTDMSKSSKFSRNANHIINNRIKEEVRVIESCLKVNAISRAESPVFEPPRVFQGCNHHRVRRESTIFNPSDYLCDGYPHLRTQACKKSNGIWCNYEKKNSDSPVFELKPERGTYRSSYL